MNTNRLLHPVSTAVYLRPVSFSLFFSLLTFCTQANSWIYNGGGNVSQTVGSNQSINRIVVTNGTTLTVNSPNYMTANLTINGDGNSNNIDFYVENGSSVIFKSGLFSNFTIKYGGSGNTTQIEGELTFEQGGNVLGSTVFKNNNSGQNTTIISGTVQVNDRTRIDATASALTFASGGQYIHNTQHSGNRIPLAVWSTGSLCKVTGFTNEPDPPTDLGQTYFDFEWDCANQTGNTSLANEQPTVLGTFKVTSTGSGKLRLNHTVNTLNFDCVNFEQSGGNLELAHGAGNTHLKISGNFNCSGGTINVNSSGETSSIELNGSTAQSITTGPMSGEIDFIINNPNGINGQLTLNDGADLTMTAGGLSAAPIYAGNNGLIYNGSTAQIAGAEWSGSISRLTIENMDGVAASNDLTLTESLTLKGGNLSLGTALLTLGTSASSTGTYTHTSGHIIGKFKRWIEASASVWDFHIGTTSQARTVNLDYTTAPVSGGSLTVEYLPFNPGSSGLPVSFGPLNIVEVSPSGHWRVEAGNGLTAGSYSITIDATDFTQANGQPISQPQKVRLIKRPTGGNWTAEGNPVMPNTLSSISSDDLIGFSEFGAGIEGAILPVDLIDFSASQNGSSNLIEWTVARQENTSRFQVEKSEDAQNWKLLETLEADGNSNNISHFFLYDEKPQCLNYYRLSSVDFDGSKNIFPPISLKRDCGNNKTLIYPNPTSNNLHILQEVTDYQTIDLSVTNGFGQVIFKQKWENIPGQNLHSIELSDWPTGLYHLSIFDGIKMESKAILKN